LDQNNFQIQQLTFSALELVVDAIAVVVAVAHVWQLGAPRQYARNERAGH
jgi:hypothetical protein